MNSEQSDKMDQIIGNGIGGEKVELNFEAWKAEHGAEISDFNSRTVISGNKSAKVFRIIKFAIAACLMISAGLLLQLMQPKAERSVSQLSPMSRFALTRAYEQGGVDAVEEQYNKAYAKLGPRAGGVSMNSLLNQ